MMNNVFYGQIHQDKFVLNVLNFKTDGFFVEIGSNDPREINNTFLLESKFGWKGIMVDCDVRFLDAYKLRRPLSFHKIGDATQIEYSELFRECNAPSNIDYLQLDLGAMDGSTVGTLKNIDQMVMDDYKFASVTFEHDIKYGDYFNTRQASREIFEKRGYVCVFKDIEAFEDWYVHPDLVNMDYISELQLLNEGAHTAHDSCGRAMVSKEIQYPIQKK